MNKILFFTLAVLFLVQMGFTEPIGTPSRNLIDYPNDEPPAKAIVELGSVLFFDNRLSGNLAQNCASCHSPSSGFSDGLKLSIGANGNDLEVHTPPLYNLAWNVVFFWDGRAPTLEQQVLMPIASSAEMDMDIKELVVRLNAVPGYQALFKQAFGTPEISQDSVAAALAAFIRSIIVDDTPFDRYMAGNMQAMTSEAIRGMELFREKARCIECHDGNNFTDNGFHNIGVDSDLPGRAAIVKDQTLRGAFKTPGLRNALLSAPYMHNGSLASLEEVVEFYNDGGARKDNLDELIEPLQLSRTEVRDLLAFLAALTQEITVPQPIVP